MNRIWTVQLISVAMLFISSQRLDAVPIAVLGNNGVATFINTGMPGFSATVVTDAQLSKTGFLNSNGAVSGLNLNASGYVPIGLIAGEATTHRVRGGGGADGSLVKTSFGFLNPITASLTLTNPGGVDFGATISGVNPSLILATYDNGNAAIIAKYGQSAVPEPTSFAIWIISATCIVTKLRPRRTSQCLAIIH